MELGKAKLCTDCAQVYEGEACPRCGSAVYWWMSKRIHVERESPMNFAPRISSQEHPDEREEMVIFSETTACSGAEVMQDCNERI